MIQVGDKVISPKFNSPLVEGEICTVSFIQGTELMLEGYPNRQFSINDLEKFFYPCKTCGEPIKSGKVIFEPVEEGSGFEYTYHEECYKERGTL